MTRSTRTALALLAALLLALGAAACGDDSGGDSGSASGDNSSTSTASDKLIKKDPANAGKTITIGSKNFAEQYILGEIYAQALKAAGFDVKKQLDLGSEQVAFKALKRGVVDAYPEYTGTALTSFYGVKTDDVPRDKQESYDLLVQKLKKDDITALPMTPFQNTYKVTSTAKTAEKYGNPETLSDLVAKAGDDVRLSGYPECRQRTDCLVGLHNVYDWHPKFVSSQGQYADLDAGQADFTMGFSTDGPLSLDKYYTYEDDKSLFPPYYVTLLTRNDAVQTLGESGKQVIQAVQEPLTEEVMQELNSRVTIDKQKPQQVASDYLKEAGFTK